MMNRPTDAAVYRVCAMAPDRWEVLQDPSDEPLACFRDKSSALTYAMSLVRGHVGWQFVLGSRPDAHSDAFTLSPEARGARV
jgi:hypothetical protein